MGNKLSLSVWLCVLPCLLSVAAMAPFGSAQGGTNVQGLISANAASSNVAWTRAGSPYNLTGPVAVDQGVTLTVEPGVTVNLNSYYIRVNGTLIARGTSIDRVIFNGGQINANSWCKIDYAIINQTSINSVVPIEVENSIIDAALSVTSSTISNNRINRSITSHSSVIQNNHVKGNIVLGSVSLGAVTAPAESSTVSGNIVEGSIISGSPQGAPQIFNNTISKGGIGCTGYGSIFNNYIHDSDVGISLYTVRVFGGNLPCYATVENNLVVGNSKGIAIDLTDVHGGAIWVPTVQKNTIAENGIGISLSMLGYDVAPIIRNNNIQDNSNCNFYLATSNNVDVSNNWWGTTNESVISNSIYDFKNDFNLGTVTFQPILTAPAPNTPTTPTSTAISTPQPTATPTVPEITSTFVIGVILVSFLVAILLKK